MTTRAATAVANANIASSSLAEVGYGLHAAARLGYLLPDTHRRLELMVRRTAAPLAGLIRRVRRGKGLASQGKNADDLTG